MSRRLCYHIRNFKQRLGIGKMNTLDIERLKECRLKLGITKQEAAKRIQISQPAYLRYEAGTRKPSVQTIAKMAEVFSTSTDYLIGNTEKKDPDRLIIEKDKNPSLFLLAESCKELDESQLKRILAYASKFSMPEFDNHK